MKRCFKCGISKPIDEFYRHPQMGDGHLNKCKDCARRDVKTNYRARLDEKHEYDRMRFQEPERRAQTYAQATKHRVLNPDKYQARTMLGNAVRDGRIKRGPCEICGTAVNVEAHHTDYSRPLDVRWLCRTHHRQVEGRLVTALPI